MTTILAAFLVGGMVGFLICLAIGVHLARRKTPPPAPKPEIRINIDPGALVRAFNEAGQLHIVNHITLPDGTRVVAITGSARPH
jgi:hypothetical protein